jgi:hypothetical protein
MLLRKIPTYNIPSLVRFWHVEDCVKDICEWMLYNSDNIVSEKSEYES